MAIVSLKWVNLDDPNKQHSFQDATGAAPVVPVPTLVSATTSSYTAAITGYDAQFTYTVSATAGTAVRTDGTVVVSGLSANQSSILTVTAANSDASRGLSFTANATFFSLPATPTLIQATENATGGTVTITNYDASVTYSVSISAGSASRTGNTITVTGLVRGQSATLTVIASNSSGNSGTATLTVSAEPIGEYEPIATITVASSGLSSITFNNIPQDYQHLQMRIMVRGTRSFDAEQLYIRINGDGGNNYSYHGMYSDIPGVTTTNGTSTNVIFIGQFPAALTASNIMGCAIVDIVDYGRANKNRVVRSFFGSENNNGPTASNQISISSGMRLNSDTVNSISVLSNGPFTSTSTVSLYGIKAP